MTGSMVKSAFRDRTEKTGLEVTWVEEVMRSAARSMAVISLFFFLLVGYTEAALEPSFVEYKDDLLTVRVSQADVLSLLEEICELVSAQIFVFDKITHHNGGVHLVDKPAEEVLKALLRGHSYAILFSSDPSPAPGVYVLGGVVRGSKEVKFPTRITEAPEARRRRGEENATKGLQGSPKGHGRSVRPAPLVLQQIGETPRGDANQAGAEAGTDSESSSGPGPAQNPQDHGGEMALQVDGGVENGQASSGPVAEAEPYLLGEIERLEWQIAARQSDGDYNSSVETLGLPPIEHDRSILEWHKEKLRKLKQK